MMVLPANKGLFLEVFDENGQKIPFVEAADPHNGFIIVYTDTYVDDKDQKTKLKSMKVERKYCKFTIGGH